MACQNKFKVKEKAKIGFVGNESIKVTHDNSTAKTLGQPKATLNSTIVKGTSARIKEPLVVEVMGRQANTLKVASVKLEEPPVTAEAVVGTPITVKGTSAKLKGTATIKCSTRKTPAELYKINERATALKSLHYMSLGELLEASAIIQKGTKGDKIPVAKSEKAKKYSEATLALNSKAPAKCAVSEMEDRLNTQILKVNRKTTDPKDAERLYRELMAGE